MASYTLLMLIALLSCRLSEQCTKSKAALSPTTLYHEQCPPWTEYSNSSCSCIKRNENSYSVSCDKDTLQLSVLIWHCVTFNNETQEIVEGDCLQNSIRKKSGYLPLPLNVTKLNQFMCEERWNRTGRLCGSCLPGHSPLAYSYDLRCVKCPEGNRNIWKYILAAFGPLTIFYFVVLFLKINATSSHLHGYLIFSQIFATPFFLRTVTKTPVQLAATMYSIWNLDFFRDLYPDICLNVSPLTALSLDYVVAIYPLLLTVVSYILIELHARNVRIVVILWKPFRFLLISLRRNWDSRTTVIDAYVTFFILSYVKLGCVCADLLMPVRTHTLKNNTVVWALFTDATMDYFGPDHLPYAVLAIIFVILMIVPVIIMLFYQFACFQKVLSCLRIRSRMLQAVMDSFQGGYKDGTTRGTRDYRWFGAVPFIGELVLLVWYATILDKSFLPLLVVIIIVIMVLTMFVQPYKAHLSTNAKIDALFWAFLAAFFSLDYASYSYESQLHRLTTATNILRIVVAMIPLLYMICVSVYWILSRMRKVKTLIGQIKAWRRGYTNIEQDFEADRMINPDRYEGENLHDICNSES